MIFINVTLPKFGPEFDPVKFDGMVSAGLENVLRNYYAEMNISQAIPVDIGTLAADIGASIEVEGEKARIGTTRIYGQVMERGRTPGQPAPPVESMIPWVKRKINPAAPPLTIKLGERIGQAKRKLREHEAALKEARKLEASRPKQLERVKVIHARSGRANRKLSDLLQRRKKQRKHKFVGAAAIARARIDRREQRALLDQARSAAARNPYQVASVRRLASRVDRAKLRIETLRTHTASKRRDSYLRSVSFLVARKIGREGIPVPLEFSGKGEMFHRTLESTQGKFQGWFLEAFAAPGAVA